MTSKEDLFDELEDVLRECSEYSSNCDYEIYNLDSAFNKLKKRLTKYERSFEILKPHIDFPSLEDFEYIEDGNYYIAEIDEYDEHLETYKNFRYLLDKEEYELLEELMSDDN